MTIRDQVFGRRSNLLGCSGTSQGMWANLGFDGGNVGFVHDWMIIPTQWSFLVPLIGGIGSMWSPNWQGLYKCYISGIHWHLGDYISRIPPIKGTRNGYWPISTWWTTHDDFLSPLRISGCLKDPFQPNWPIRPGRLPILQVARATLGPRESQESQGPQTSD